MVTSMLSWAKEITAEHLPQPVFEDAFLEDWLRYMGIAPVSIAALDRNDNPITLAPRRHMESIGTGKPVNFNCQASSSVAVHFSAGKWDTFTMPAGDLGSGLEFPFYEKVVTIQPEQAPWAVARFPAFRLKYINAEIDPHRCARCGNPQVFADTLVGTNRTDCDNCRMENGDVWYCWLCGDGSAPTGGVGWLSDLNDCENCGCRVDHRVSQINIKIQAIRERVNSHPVQINQELST